MIDADTLRFLVLATFSWRSHPVCLPLGWLQEWSALAFYALVNRIHSEPGLVAHRKLGLTVSKPILCALRLSPPRILRLSPPCVLCLSLGIVAPFLMVSETIGDHPLPGLDVRARRCRTSSVPFHRLAPV